MSDDALIAERYAPDDNGEAGEERAIASSFKRLRSEPLLPEAGAGGAPLTAVIAVISFLAALSLAAFLVIASAAGEWTEELKTSFTVQIKGADAATQSKHIRMKLCAFCQRRAALLKRALLNRMKRRNCSNPGSAREILATI